MGIYILLPVVLIFIGSFGKKWFRTLLPQRITLEWYRTLFSEKIYLRSLEMSIFVGILTVLATAFLAIPTMYAVHTSERKSLRILFDAMVVLPIALSPIVLGIGLVQVDNWPSFSLVGTWQLLFLPT